MDANTQKEEYFRQQENKTCRHMTHHDLFEFFNTKRMKGIYMCINPFSISPHTL